MPSSRVLGGGAATIAIARVTLLRTLRTRMTIGAACVAALPFVLASSLHASHHDDRANVFSLAVAGAFVIVGLVVAGPIGEEFEDRTMTYLWSRPLPRWSVVTGKLAALVPLAALLFAGGVALSFQVLSGDAARSSVVDGAIGAIGGTIAMAALAAAMATLVPKHALALTIAFLFFFDLPVAAIPARIQLVSIGYHLSSLARIDLDESRLDAALGLAAITAVWMAVALWRVRRLE